jgi:hypothetical protein
MKNYFLIYLPFLLFASTYIYLIYYYQRDKSPVPKLVGTLLSDLTMGYSNDLIFKIVKVAYNKEYEDNYIIGQYPLPGSLIRSNQIISLEVNSNKNRGVNDLLYKANIQDVGLMKENYKKEGVLYKIINFYSADTNLKNISTIYDKNKNLTYAYVNVKPDIAKIYIKNIKGKKCNQLFLKYPCVCYGLDNMPIDRCPGREVINQFPLPGVYIKNENTIKIHLWHG